MNAACQHEDGEHPGLKGAALRRAISLAEGRCAAIQERLTAPRRRVLELLLEADAPLRLAEPGATATVRSQSVHRIAAVLEGSLPLDIRHRSKIRRDELAASVSTFLEGR